MMNSGATPAGRHAKLADTSDPDAWANTLDALAHDDKRAGDSEDRIHTTDSRTDSPVIRICREELRPLIQVEVKSAVEVARRNEI